MEKFDDNFITIEDIPDLYKKHLKEILAFVYNFVHNPDDARELAQDVFYKFCLEVKNKKIVNTFPRALLFKIARNLCIDNLRKRKIETCVLTENIKVPASNNTPEEKIINEILLDSLKKYIDTGLSEIESNVFRLKYYYKLNLEEISYVIDSSISSVSRMIKKIIRQLEKEFPDIF